MAISPIGSTQNVNRGNNTSLSSMGLDMQSLLQIILTQLTYQDPLKPVDNFEFVSQLAQFTSLEQTRQMTDKMDSLLSVQSSDQTLSLLGRNVDVQTDTSLLSGVVKSISLQGTQPQLTVETADGQFLTNATLTQIVTVR
ncbi:MULTISPECIES: flagellar hook assembly protein FlgD [unclassified Caballeronia]|uniref:flagellar hook assembly protein FlgD n=1 Tax=unclassified Caballeronia TaxID=2646786 RepID=UPI002854BF80|nr:MULTISPECIES: flagellar hook capping FlgD N-terminal domain-containing protein [unclassified Caballeronia]MDR5774152.1 flagellar hook capping FlgD N-terminal domain-containing protein [Caballeronia sp. LZ002]MDR5849587.1 flagellar hook capping FlgD N-terminal domain-containing protein [Caballeronia sp. LZ003]